MVNSPKGAALADRLLRLCELGAPPHERAGFVVRGPRRWLTHDEALAFDFSVLDGATRHRREEVRKAVAHEKTVKGNGINTVIRMLRMLVRA